MTRHGKNCTAASVYSYAERRRDAKISGYGTLHERLGADSVKEFDCCSLTLQPCREAVITPNGYVFDRQSVLEYILAQKKMISKKTKEWEKQCNMEKKQEQKVVDDAHDRRVAKFAALEATPAHPGAKVDLSVFDTPRREAGTSTLKRPATDGNTIAFGAPVEKVKALGTEGELSNMSAGRSKELPSFWIPELNPTASKSKLEKPNQKVLCPLSGKPLKLKDLMEVKFTPIKGYEDKKIGTKKERYMCAVTHDALTNSTRCAYIKPSKCVVTWACVEKIIKKDMIDPISGNAITDDDIIELQRGGTGFAATNEVKAKLVRPQLELQ